jgi:hypothetical protein
MGMMDMGDAVADGNGQALLDATKRTGGALADTAGRIIGPAAAIGTAGQLGVSMLGKLAPGAVAPGVASALAGTGEILMPGSARLLASGSKYMRGAGTAYNWAGTAAIPAALATAAENYDGESQRPLDISGSDDPRLQHLLGQEARPQPASRGLSPRSLDNSFNVTAANQGFGPGVLSADAIGANVRTPFDNVGGLPGTIAQLLGNQARSSLFGGVNHQALVGGRE